MRVEEGGGVADLEAKRRGDDQFGVGRMARLIAMGPCYAARPVQLPSGWSWLRSRLGKKRDNAGRMSGPEGARPLLVGLAGARSVPGVAAPGVTVAGKKALVGRAGAPRGGGARMYFMNGSSR